MTEKLYSLEDIEKATKQGLRNDGFTEDEIKCRWDAIDTELTRPQPEFREGQVLANDHGMQTDYMIFTEHYDPETFNGFRPLTPEEVGPGYVAVEDVRPLVKAIDYAADYDIGISKDRARHLFDALPDNLEELIDE